MRRQRATLERWAGYAATLQRARRKWGLSRFRALSTFGSLAFGRQYSPEEIFRIGLLDRESPLAAPSLAISKEAMLHVQRRLNPPGRHHLTEDKIDFFLACRQHGLPTPPVLAVFLTSDRPGVPVPVLRSRDELLQFVSERREDFVVKPLDGTHARGVLVLTAEPGGCWNTGGAILTAGELHRHVETSAYDDWIVQPRLVAAEGLRALSGTDVVQTTRMVTLIDEDGDAEVLLAWQRIVAGRARADNFNLGAPGHLVASVGVDSGCMRTGVSVSDDGLGLVPVERHPRSGVRIEGFPIPDWEAAVALVRRAAKCFLPLRTIGWDVAITPEGPMLIEGNVTWDPMVANVDLPDAVARLQRCVGPSIGGPNRRDGSAPRTISSA